MSKKKKEKTDKQVFQRWVIVMILAFLAGIFGGLLVEQKSKEHDKKVGWRRCTRCD